MSERRPGFDRGRKPAHVLASSGRPDNQAAIWQAICSLQVFHHAQLCKEIYHQQGRSVADDTVRSYVRRLERGGYITLLEEQKLQGNAVRKLYEIGLRAPHDAPRLSKTGEPVTQGLAQENMWRTMRIIWIFTPRDLAIQATTEEVEVSETAAKDYCKRLKAAGYLVVVKENNGPHSQATYRLIPDKWTGPKAPMIQRIKAVFDPNLGKVVWPVEVQA